MKRTLLPHARLPRRPAPARPLLARLVGSCLLLGGMPALAESGNPSLPEPARLAPAVVQENVATRPWSPSPPVADEFDWVQLTSGEWLKGEMRVLYRDTLEFDSEELDLLSLDWEDVHQLRTHDLKSVRFSGPVTVIGIVRVTPDSVIVTTGKLEQVFDRSRLVSIAAGEDKEIRYWSARISLGLNLARGNTEQTDFNTIANLKRRTSATRFQLDYLAKYTRTRDIDTVDNNRLNIVVDIFATRRYFWRPFLGEYYRDPFQNIQRRITAGAGGGYTLINSPKTEWDLDAGLAYQTTRFISVEAGEDLDVSTPVLYMGTRFETELNKRMDFKINYTFKLVNQKSGRYTHHMISTLETGLLSWLDFDISFVWDRTEDPTPLENGTVPETNDYQVIFSLGFDYH